MYSTNLPRACALGYAGVSPLQGSSIDVLKGDRPAVSLSKLNGQKYIVYWLLMSMLCSKW